MRGRFRQGVLRAAVLAAVGAGAGCAADEARIEDPPLPVAGDSALAPPPVPGAGRAEVKEGVIDLEGSREPMVYRLYRTPEGFPLPFSTYVPEDMQAEDAVIGGAPAVRFAAAFGGVRNGAMELSARFPEEPLTAGEARARAREIAGELGRAEPAGDRFPWALEAYRFSGEESQVGSVALGRHAGRYFFVVTRHPAEAGDGFGPRAARILDEWRWAEGGALGS